MFNDPGLLPLGTNLNHLPILVEVFLNLVHQVQMLTGMLQGITLLLPQLA